MVDKLWWNEHNKGVYKVSAAYKRLNWTVAQDPIWPWKQIWRTKAPLKVACFSHLLAKEVVLTHEILRKRNIILVTHCCIYLVRQLRQWDICFCIVESLTNYGKFSLISEAYNGQCLARLLALYLGGKKLRREQKTRATGELLSWIWWTIWKERNVRCFEDMSREVQKIKTDCILLLCFGVKGTST